MREVITMSAVSEEEEEEEGRRKTLPTFTDKHYVPGTVPDIMLSVACALTPCIPCQITTYNYTRFTDGKTETWGHQPVQGGGRICALTASCVAGSQVPPPGLAASLRPPHRLHRE